MNTIIMIIKFVVFMGILLFIGWLIENGLGEG